MSLNWPYFNFYACVSCLSLNMGEDGIALLESVQSEVIPAPSATPVDHYVSLTI